LQPVQRSRRCRSALSSMRGIPPTYLSNRVARECVRYRALG
jgi:hypothetical protein